MKLDGSTPTLMFGYGGFEVAETPSYRPELGKLWLERGGAYVIANISGGGEFGPAWHDAALQPDLAHLRQVDRRLGDLEPAIAVHDGRRRSVELHPLRPHQEVRNLRPVRRRRPVLFDHVLGGVEAGRQDLHLRRGE